MWIQSNTVYVRLLVGEFLTEKKTLVNPKKQGLYIENRRTNGCEGGTFAPSQLNDECAKKEICFLPEHARLD